MNKQSGSTSESDVPSPSSSVLKRVFGTWPGRIGALVVSGAVAWVVSQAMPALWGEASERTGLAPGPLQVEVVTDPDVIQTLTAHNPIFVIQRPIEAIGPPPNGDDERGRFRWAKAMDGVDALATVVRLVISGRGSAPVTVHSLEVEKVETTQSLAGTLVTYTGQGAGQPVRYFAIDLDREPAEVKYLLNGNEKAAFPYRVSQSELELFDIYASTSRNHIAWRLRLHYTAEDGQGSVVIDDGGEPFRTTAMASAAFWEGRGPPPQAAYYWRAGRWWDE